MKKLAHIVLLACALAFASAPVALVTGCKSSPATVAYKTADAVVTSVDLAMSAWYDYAIAEEHRLAKLPAAERGPLADDLLRQQGRVIAAHGVYLEAVRASRAAIQANAPAPANLSKAAGELLAVIQSVKH